MRGANDPAVLEPPGELRLYRAIATAHFILGSIDRLVAVNLLR